MKKIILTIVFASSIIFAQSNPGGLANLNLGFSARDIAMGDLGVSTSMGASAFYYNPSLLNGNHSSILISHNSYIQDVSSEFLGVTFSFLSLPFAFGVSTTSIPDIEIRTKAGAVQGEFNAHYFYGGLSTAFSLYNKLRTGITLKYLYEGLFSDEAMGYAVDLGFSYSGFYTERLDLGLVVKNIGSMNELRNQSTQLPSEVKLGASYSEDIKGIDSKLIVTTGIQKYFTADDIHIHSGVELQYSNYLFIRLGYITGYESKNLSAGFGTQWNSFKFDYSYVPYSYNLGSSNFITVSYNFY